MGRPNRPSKPASRKPPRGAPRPPVDRKSRIALEISRVAKPAVAKQAGDLLDRAVDKLALGDARGAAEAAIRARALAPRSGGAREVLGMALYQQGEYREALRELQAYKRITGRSDQNHLIADSHRALGSPEKAVPLAEEALRAQGVPDEAKAEAAVVGASALADLGRTTEALTLLRRWRTQESQGVRPWDLRVWYVAGDVLARAGRVEDARAEFERVLRHDADAYDVRERLDALGAPPPPPPRTPKKKKPAGRGGAAKPPAVRRGSPKRAARRTG